MFKGGYLMNRNYQSIDIGSMSVELLDDNILYFREDGSLIRDELIAQIKNIDCQVIMLDFKNVKAIDFSCSDEIVVAIQENNDWLKGKKIFLGNLSKSHKENIVSALEKKKLGVWILENNEYQLIGKLPNHLIELLNLIRYKKSVTARLLSDELSEDIASISVKLGKLYKKGMLLREEQKSSEGMQYQYYSIVDLIN
jgi:DNA-binding transcriptional ArsR family regulator